MNAFRLSLLILLSSTASSAWSKGGYLYEYAGDVKISVTGSPTRVATDSMPLNDNFAITTGERSRAVIKFEDGQIIALSSNTTFQIKQYVYDKERAEKSSVFFSLFKGGLRAITGLIGKHNKQAFKIATPTATIGIRGTDFMLQTEGKAMHGQVTEGVMIMQTASTQGVFKAGQNSFIPSPAATPAIPTTVNPLTFIRLQVIATPPPTPAHPPTPGTRTPPPTAKTLAALAKSIKVAGVKPADIATAMIQVGNKSAVVATGIVTFAPKEAASVTTALVTATPQDAAVITSATVTAAPTLAAAITTAAVTAAPAQAAAITTAAVTAAPTQAIAITTAAVTAAPDQAAAITSAAITVAPTLAVAITEAVITVAPTEATAITEAAVTAAPTQSAEIINAVDSVIGPIPETTVIPPPTGGGTVSPN